MSSGAKSLRSLLLAFVSPSLESPSPQLHDEVRKSTGRHNRKRCRRSGAEIYETWLASRALTHEKGEYLAPGAHRPLSRSSLKLACEITRLCAFDLLNLLWALHPWRTVLMVSLEFIRGVFPVFRGYSQALLINEVCFHDFHPGRTCLTDSYVSCNHWFRTKILPGLGLLNL